MTIPYSDIRDALVSLGQSGGFYDSVNSHEPRSAPGSGLSLHVFTDSLIPIRAGGLNSTSVRLAWNMQTRCNMTREPMDDIDLDCAKAADWLLAELSGDFDLDITGVRHVDLLGAYGDPLGWTAGYIDQDSVLYRAYNLLVPVIIDNAFSQGA